MIDMTKILLIHTLMVISWCCLRMLHTLIGMLAFLVFFMQWFCKWVQNQSLGIQKRWNSFWFGGSALITMRWGDGRPKNCIRSVFSRATRYLVFWIQLTSMIICGVHLIPQFLLGHTKELLGPSFSQSVLEKDKDWVWYYVNMHVNHCFIVC